MMEQYRTQTIEKILIEAPVSDEIKKQRQEYGNSKIKQQTQKRILIRHVSPENGSI
jgi:hypothetical protein